MADDRDDMLHDATQDRAHTNGDGGAADARGEPDALLDRVSASVRDTPVPDGPGERLLADTLSALLAAEASDAINPQHQNRKLPTMKTLFKFAVAACVLAAAAVALLAAWPSRQSLAFANVLQQVHQAKSVRFNATNRVHLPDGKEQVVDATMTILGNRMRQEAIGVVSLFDFEKGELLVLQPAQKQGMRMTMQNMPPEAKSMNLIDQFRKIRADQGKDIGVKEFDGRALHGFRVEQPGMSMTVWADPAKQEPVRIETAFDMPSIAKMSAVMTHFDWDVAVDPASVSLDAPEGYAIQSMTMDISPPTEADLLQALRTVASLNGGTFPASFDVAGLGELIVARAPKDASQRQAFEKELMPQVFAVSRGLGFMNPRIGADGHYAGAGVRLDQPERAVLWYKPAGSATYRVVHADLSVAAGVPADALPKVEAKAITPGPSPFPPAQNAGPQPAPGTGGSR
jgi:hypothetical protein